MEGKATFEQILRASRNLARGLAASQEARLDETPVEDDLSSRGIGSRPVSSPLFVLSTRVGNRKLKKDRRDSRVNRAYRENVAAIPRRTSRRVAVAVSSEEEIGINAQ